MPRDGYGSIDILKEKPIAFFSHRHAAYCAGLGNFGLNNMLLTPQYGPRVRFASILTDCRTPRGPVLEEPLCIQCGWCVSICPVDSPFPGAGYPEESRTRLPVPPVRKNCTGGISPRAGAASRSARSEMTGKQYGREDMRMYDEKSPVSDPYRRARDHVRSFGSR